MESGMSKRAFTLELRELQATHPVIMFARLEVEGKETVEQLFESLVSKMRKEKFYKHEQPNHRRDQAPFRDPRRNDAGSS